MKISLGVTILLIVVLLWRKKEKKPSKLKLEAYEDPSNRLQGIKKVKAEAVADSDDEVTSEGFKDSDIFTFKGKKHSATQVLGVPKGASLAELKQAFAKKSTADKVNEALYFAAYKKLQKN